YSTPEDQKEHIEKQGAVKNFQTLSDTDSGTNLSVVETDNAVLIAARGTSPPWIANLGQENEWSWKDLGADLDAGPVPNYDGRATVHDGFRDQADGIWPKLQPALA